MAKKTKPPVVRSEVGVVVFNNTSISGLAGEVLARVQEIGWNGVAADNWYGTIPATTVYFPPGKRDAAQKLAQRLRPAADASLSQAIDQAYLITLSRRPTDTEAQRMQSFIERQTGSYGKMPQERARVRIIPA